ncbi:MAG: cryptochrome/photolyase family protein, partial [Enterobacter sp.]|nr:cryptochrome/photolyase family protein [Enterobacter sp.]
MTELRLILGDQLNPHHSWFDTCSPNIIYVMLELRAETDYVLHHAQKVIAIFAAMRAFSSALKEKGHRVRYVRLSDDSNRGALEDNLNALVAHYGAGRVIWQEP